MKRTLSLLPFALFLIILPFPGTVAARLLLLVICFGVAIWHWWNVSGARAEIPCKPALFLWLIVCSASLSYTVDFVYTAGELKNELGYTMMAFFAFFVVAADRTAAATLFRAAAIGLVLIGSWATVGWAGNGFWWDESGRYGGIGVFSTYLVTIVPILAWLTLEDLRSAMRRVAMGLLLFALFLAVISMQRAAWPALALQALVVLGYVFRRRLVHIGWRGVAGMAIVVVLAGAAGLQFIHHQRVSTPGQLADDVRVAYWPRAAATIAEHPLAGAGFGRRVTYKAYPELTPANVTDLWHAHNVLLNYGLQLGVPGMIAFVWLLSAFAYLFWQAAAQGFGWAGVAGLALICGVLMRNQFNDFFVRDMSLLFWAIMGVLVRLSRATNEDAKNRQARSAPCFEKH